MQPPPSSSRHAGFSLIEVTLAIGVAAFCLVAIMGLFPVGLNANQASLQGTLAADVATRIFADLRTTPLAGGTASHLYAIAFPSPGLSSTTTMLVSPSGSGTNGIVDPNYKTTNSPWDPIRFQVNAILATPPLPPGANSSAPPPGQATRVRILVSWPAGATPANASGYYEIVGALNRD